MPAAAPAVKRQTDRRPLVENRLRHLRERGKRDGGLWLTLDEVSKALGYHLSTVSRHENNERSLSEEDVVNYARLYKVRPDQLFKGLTQNSRSR